MKRWLPLFFISAFLLSLAPSTPLAVASEEPDPELAAIFIYLGPCIDYCGKKYSDPLQIQACIDGCYQQE